MANTHANSIRKAIVIQAGNISKEILLSKETQSVHVDFDGVRGAQSIIFNVPDPTSPKDLGLNADTRKLGIGIVSLTILPQM